MRPTLGRLIPMLALVTVSISCRNVPESVVINRPVEPTRECTITDLGTLGGESIAQGVNDKCEVTGRSDSKAFIWKPGGPMRELDKSLGTSLGWRINNAGQVVGIMYPGARVAFFWDPTKGIRQLQLTQRDGEGLGINESGAVVGQVYYPQVAFRFDPDNGLRDISANVGGEGSVAQGINSSGAIAGGKSYGSAWIWDPKGGLRFAPGKRHAGFAAINEAGHAVGQSYGGSGGDEMAVLWDGAGALRDLGTLGGAASEAYDINDADVVVGKSKTADGREHAFVYRDGKMTDLNDLLPKDSGWDLTTARDINNRGQIVGQGIHNGQRRAFLLSPPPE